MVWHSSCALWPQDKGGPDGLALACARTGRTDRGFKALKQTVKLAFKIGDTLDALKQARLELEAAGIASTAIDHIVSKSLYLADPDGTRIELYVDQSDVWKQDSQAVASSAPMML